MQTTKRDTAAARDIEDSAPSWFGREPSNLGIEIRDVGSPNDGCQDPREKLTLYDRVIGCGLKPAAAPVLAELGHVHRISAPAYAREQPAWGCLRHRLSCPA